jgi:predicted P-loop ATPase
MNAPGLPLSLTDIDGLAKRWIDAKTACAAGLRRVDSRIGAEITGQTKSGDYSGIAIPYLWPGSTDIRDYRLRRDHPELEQRPDGSLAQRRKYVGPPGRGNMLYVPPGADPELLTDARIPVIVVEGEFKTLSLWRLAWYDTAGAREAPSFLPVGLQGVWNWRGVIGKTSDAGGQRVDVHGPIPDLARIEWDGRRVIVAFDADLAQKIDVQEARRRLTAELDGRGALLSWFEWPKDTPAELKGVDDLLAARGPEFVLAHLSRARPVPVKKKSRSGTATAAGDWRDRLIRNGDGSPKAILANAITAIRSAPEFEGRLRFDEFRVCSVASAPLPWAAEPQKWTDVDDILLAEWLQRNGINVSREIAGQAVEVVSRERLFHPVREYLDRLTWDGIGRDGHLAIEYLGATAGDGGEEYLKAVGSRLLLAMQARIWQPGCKADQCPVLEGGQGIYKSSFLKALAGPEWFTDDIHELGSKDSAMQLQGVWLVELAEMDAWGRSEISAGKAFLSRSADRIRLPYGRRVIEMPRQNVFCGTINKSEYLADETGNRRFWPIRCGRIDIEALARDRDQLLAEALVRYRSGAPWWLDNRELVSLAEVEQAARYDGDAWDQVLLDWAEGRIASGHGSISVSEALEQALAKPRGQWTRVDGMRVGRAFKAARWERYRDRQRGMEWRYRPPVPTAAGTVPTSAG